MGTVIIQEPKRIALRKPTFGSPSLDELEKHVGGGVELVWQGRTVTGDLAQFFVNEDDESPGLSPNPEANVLFTTLFGEQHPQIFVGTVVALVGRDVLVR